jgi:hypothetical protein
MARALDHTPARNREGATPGFIVSAITLLLLVRGSEWLGRWLDEISGNHASQAGRHRRRVI